MIDLNLNKASANTFHLVFPKLPISTDGERELMLNINGTVIPSIAIGETTQHWMGGTRKFPEGNVQFGDWEMNFLVDEKLKNWQLLYSWMMYINNNKDKYVEYQFQTDATLQILDNYKNKILDLKIVNAWPTRLGQINMTYTEGNSYLQCSVALGFDRLEIIA